MRKTTVQLEPMSYAMTEEMKTLRTNILFCGNDKKVITVTSCVMGEGKTKISIRLATSLVELKKRVLLIDADLRKSVMASRLKATGADKGLTHKKIDTANSEYSNVSEAELGRQIKENLKKR